MCTLTLGGLFRWMRPLADAAAAAVIDPEHCIEADEAGNDENASSIANVRQTMPSRVCAKQAKALCSVQPFLKAVANAAALAKVRVLHSHLDQQSLALSSHCIGAASNWAQDCAGSFCKATVRPAQCRCFQKAEKEYLQPVCLCCSSIQSGG